MYVFDATPLIYLGTVDRLDLIESLPDECSMPRRVYDEVVTAGLEADEADARRVERLVESESVAVLEAASATFDRLRENDSLSETDAAVLALAAERNGIAVMDEAYGRRVADAENVPTRGTAYVILSSLERDVIDGDTALETIDAVLDAGWYCSPDLYAKIRDRIDTLS